VKFDTPIVMLIYNRPAETKRVFETIKSLKPTKLFIVADGPKNAFDRKDCDVARKIVEDVNWEVDMQRNVSDKNMGCAKRTASGLDWVFSKTDKAIILEDDCLPQPSFFRYCAELLDYYYDDHEVMHIAGCNLNVPLPTDTSYIFSNWISCWGWATWARAWQKHDSTFSTWQRSSNELQKYIKPEHRPFWNSIFRACENGQLDWSLPWMLDIWNNKALGVTPTKNLITNIGWGPQASTNWNSSSIYGHLPTGDLKFPLIHPGKDRNIFNDVLADAMTQMHKDIFA